MQKSQQTTPTLTQSSIQDVINFCTEIQPLVKRCQNNYKDNMEDAIKILQLTDDMTRIDKYGKVIGQMEKRTKEITTLLRTDKKNKQLQEERNSLEDALKKTEKTFKSFCKIDDTIRKDERLRFKGYVFFKQKEGEGRIAKVTTFTYGGSTYDANSAFEVQLKCDIKKSITSLILPSYSINQGFSECITKTSNDISERLFSEYKGKPYYIFDEIVKGVQKAMPEVEDELKEPLRETMMDAIDTFQGKKGKEPFVEYAEEFVTQLDSDKQINYELLKTTTEEFIKGNEDECISLISNIHQNDKGDITKIKNIIEDKKEDEERQLKWEAKQKKTITKAAEVETAKNQPVYEEEKKSSAIMSVNQSSNPISNQFELPKPLAQKPFERKKSNWGKGSGVSSKSNRSTSVNKNEENGVGRAPSQTISKTAGVRSQTRLNGTNIFEKRVGMGRSTARSFSSNESTKTISGKHPNTKEITKRLGHSASATRLSHEDQVEKHRSRGLLNKLGIKNSYEYEREKGNDGKLPVKSRLGHQGDQEGKSMQILNKKNISSNKSLSSFRGS
jgi:hypothetical protein